MTKILLISSEFPPEPGGIGNHAYNLAIQLQKNNFEIWLLTNERDRGKDTAFDANLSINITRTPRFKVTFCTYIKRFIQAFSIIKKQKNEIIIASGKFSLWLSAVLRIFFPKIQLIGVLHGSEIRPPSQLDKFITNWSLKRFSSHIAVSNFTKEIALSHIPSLKIRVINNGFDPTRLRVDCRKEIKGKPSLITVGNVSYRKGQQNVIQAIPFLRQYFPDIHYHIVGIPSEREAFNTLAIKLGVTNHITFHGPVPTKEMVALLTDADVFVMLSQKLKNGDVEGFGIAILEANYLGIPAIGANDSGITDAISQGKSGFLVATDSAEELYNAICQVMSDRKTFSTQAKVWSEEFLWERVILDYLEVLSKNQSKLD